jgi:hypothetical protein
VRVLTLATLGALPRARALGHSLRAHQPDWPFEIVLLAGERVAASAAQDEGSLRVRSVCDDLDLDLAALLALHGEEDLTALLLPSLLRRRAEQSGEAVLHLPSGVWVLDTLAPIESALSSHSVLLVPRCTVELPDDGLEPSRSELERVGRMEETIVGVDGGADSLAFLEWWGAHVERALGSLDARRAGERPEDRPWLARLLELAPARFATAVLDDPGCNLSMWNLHTHTLAADPDGSLLVDGHRPLRFLNLPGFDPDHPHRLGATASRARVSRAPVLHELCERYAAELRRSGWRDSDRHAEVGRRLQEGLVYDESLRALYASALALGEPVEELFDEQGTRAFVAWLEGPAPRGSAHGISRYVFHRVARERPDVVRAYPDLDGDDGEEYLTWCWAFGREELSIPDRFMPPRPGHPRTRADNAAGRRSGGHSSFPRRPRDATALRRAAGRAGGAGLGAARSEAGRNPRGRSGGPSDRLPRSHPWPRRGRARLCAGAGRCRRARAHRHRAAAPPRAAGRARRRIRPPRLRGSRPRRPSRL